MKQLITTYLMNRTYDDLENLLISVCNYTVNYSTNASKNNVYVRIANINQSHLWKVPNGIWNVNKTQNNLIIQYSLISHLFTTMYSLVHLQVSYYNFLQIYHM